MPHNDPLNCGTMRMHGALFLVSLLIPVSASAQPPSSSLWLTAERLPTIFVLDDQGTEHRGKLLRVDAEQLEPLIDDKERIFKRDTVQRVQKRVTRSGTGAATGAICRDSRAVLCPPYAALRCRRPSEVAPISSFRDVATGRGGILSFVISPHEPARTLVLTRRRGAANRRPRMIVRRWRLADGSRSALPRGV